MVRDNNMTAKTSEQMQKRHRCLSSAARNGFMERQGYLIDDPVVVVSHNFTYYAPEEVMAVPLRRPTIITFGSRPASRMPTNLPRIHLLLPEVVEDRLREDAASIVQKHVKVAPLHGALIFRDRMLFYKHLCDLPTVVAERILDAQPIVAPGTVVRLHRGQTIGLGLTSDAFGGIMWWYYLRVYSLRQLKKAAR